MARRHEAEAAKHKARSMERKTDVADHIKRLGGRTRDDVTGDPIRGWAQETNLGGERTRSRYFEEEWPHRRRQLKWDDLDWTAKRARCMYPNLMEPELRNEVEQIARGENKKSPMQGMKDAELARQRQSRTKW